MVVEAGNAENRKLLISRFGFDESNSFYLYFNYVLFGNKQHGVNLRGSKMDF